MDATQWAGLGAFGMAAVACSQLRRPTGPVLTAVNASLAAECMLGLRHHLHDRAIALMGVYYPERELLQVTVILVVGVAALIVFKRVRQIWRSAVPAVPLATTGAALFLFAVEMISLHDVDRILYHPAGPILAIGWAWIGIGISTAFGSISWRRRHN